MGSLTGSAETGRSYTGYFAGIDPDSTQYSTTGAYAGRAFGNVTSLLEAGGRGALAGSAIPGGALVGGTVGVAAETAKMTVELGRQTAGLYNDRAVAAEGAAKTDKMLEASKSTNTYGLDSTELNRAKDEASVKIKLGKAKAGGDTVEEARLQKELESLKNIRVKDREKDHYFSGSGGDSKQFTTAVTEMVAQQQEADKALQTPASAAKEKAKTEEGAAGLASDSKPIYMKVLEDILTAIKPSSTDSTTDSASIDTAIEDVSAVNAAEVLPKVIEETEAVAAVSNITEPQQPIGSLQTESKPIYMKVLEDILGALVRPEQEKKLKERIDQAVNSSSIPSSISQSDAESLDFRQKAFADLDKTMQGRPEEVQNQMKASLVKKLADASPAMSKLLDTSTLSMDSNSPNGKAEPKTFRDMLLQAASAPLSSTGLLVPDSIKGMIPASMVGTGGEMMSSLLPAASSGAMSGMGGGAFSIPPEVSKGFNGIMGKGSDIIASAMDLFKRAKTSGAGDLSSMMSNNAPQADIEQYIRSGLDSLANPQPVTTGTPAEHEAYNKEVSRLEERVKVGGQTVEKLKAKYNGPGGGSEDTRADLIHAEKQLTTDKDLLEKQKKITPGPLTTTPVSPEQQAQAEVAKALLRKIQITGGSSPAVLQAAVQDIGQKQITALASKTRSPIVGPVVPSPAMGPALPPANNRSDKFIASSQSSQLGTSPGDTPPTSSVQPVAPAPAPAPADLKSKQVSSLKALQAARAKVAGLQSGDPAFANEDYFALQEDVDTKQKEYKSATKEYVESQLSPAGKAAREKNKLIANKEAAKKKLIGAQESQTNNMFSSFSGTSENGMTDYGLGDTAKVASAEKEYQSSVDALKTSPQLSGSPPIESDADRNKRRALQEAMPFYEREIKEGRTPFGNDGQPIDIVKKREELAKLKEPLLASITPEQRKRNNNNKFHALADAMPYYEKEVAEGRTPLDSKGEPINIEQKRSELATLRQQRLDSMSPAQKASRQKYMNKMAQNKTFGALTKASDDVENLEREHADSLGMSYGDLLADKEKIGTFRQTDKYKEAKQTESDARLAYRGVKDLPTVGDDFDKSGHRKNAGYAAMMSGRREAYLSKFRPEVRERMMTKAEKSARALSQAQVEIQQPNSPSLLDPAVSDPAVSGQFASVQIQQQTQEATKPTVTASGSVASTVPDATLAADRKAYEDEKKAQEDKKYNAQLAANKAGLDSRDADNEYEIAQHYTDEELDRGLYFGVKIKKGETEDQAKADKDRLQKQRDERIAQANQKKKAADEKDKQARAEADQASQSYEQWNKDNQGREDSLAQRGEAENKRMQLEKDRELVSTGNLSETDKLFGESSAMYGNFFSSGHMEAANEDKALQGKVARGETLTSEEQTKHDTYRKKQQKYYDDRMASARTNVAANQVTPTPSVPSSPAEAQAAAGSVVTPTSSSATTPNQQKQDPQLARRMTYLSRFNPQVRAAVIKKLPKAEQERIKAADEAAQQQQVAAGSPPPVPSSIPSESQAIAGSALVNPVVSKDGGASTFSAAAGPSISGQSEELVRRAQAGPPQASLLSAEQLSAGSIDGGVLSDSQNQPRGRNMTPLAGQSTPTAPVSSMSQLPTSSPVTTAVPAAQNAQQQNAANAITLDEASKQFLSSYKITLDESAKQFLTEFGSSFGSYIDQLSKIHIPDKIEMSHNGVVEVRVSGAAAFSALEEKMQKAINDAVSQKMEKIWNQSGGQLGDSPSMPVGKAGRQA